MPSGKDFAKEFVNLLNETKFPVDVPAADVLQQTHIVVYALTTRLLGQLGQKLTIADLAAQGTHGGGGPHRLDLLLHYALDVDLKTMKATAEFFRS